MQTNPTSYRIGRRFRGAGSFLHGLMFLGVLFEATHSLAGDHPTASFTEESVSRGIVYNYVAHGDQYGSGLAFVDLDNDGDDDIVVTGDPSGLVGVFENNGAGIFIDRSADSRVTEVPHSSGVVAADFDGDGLIDLYLTQWGGANVLARNRGGFSFEDVTAAAGVGFHHSGTGPAAGDYDNDGYLDLFVPNYTDLPGLPPAYDLLYHNQGNGTFAEVGAAMGVNDPWRGFQGVFFDYDFDGDVDLYLSNDKRFANETVMHNRLWRNDNGQLVDVSEFSGTDVNIASMGVAVGDVDNNGYPDLYCTNLFFEPTPLLLNQGNGTFVESSAVAGVESFRTGWGTLFVDYDNDQNLDLLVCNAATPNRLYDCDGGFPCTDVAPDVGLDMDAISYCLAASDIDNDGDLDFLIQTDTLGIRLFINRQSVPSHWAKVRLRGQAPNTKAVGSTIFLRTGDRWQQRQVISGMSFKSHTSYVQHFGLADHATIDELRVLWPGGATTTLSNLAADQTIEIVQPESCTPPSAANTPMPTDGTMLLSQSVTLQWLGSAGINKKVYFGATLPLPLYGETTASSMQVANLELGKTYYWRVDTVGCATTTGPVWSFSTSVDTSTDLQPPQITITNPTSQNTSSTFLLATVGGTAQDNVLVERVSWTGSNGVSGNCTGTNSWSCGPTELNVGANYFTITATDSSGLSSSAQLTINYSSNTDAIMDLVLSPSILEFSPEQIEKTLRVNASAEPGATYTVRASESWVTVAPLIGQSSGPRDVKEHLVSIDRGQMPTSGNHFAVVTVSTDDASIEKRIVVMAETNDMPSDEPDNEPADDEPVANANDNSDAQEPDGDVPAEQPVDTNEQPTTDSPSHQVTPRACGPIGFINLITMLSCLVLALQIRASRKQ